MMMKEGYGRRVLFRALIASAVLSGCVSKPAVTLHHAGLRSASFRGLGLDIFLQVYNKNSYDIQIRGVRADVLIARKYPLAPINLQSSQWLTAGETTIVHVPITIPWSVMPPLIAETAGSSTITYRVKGSADVTAVRMLGIEWDAYPVDEEGEISRQALVEAAQRMIAR